MEMSGARRRPDASTRKVDTTALAARTRTPVTKPPAAKPAQSIGTEPPPAVGRTVTLHDPLTTQLLAEVTRRSRTMDLDEEVIDEVLDKVEDTSHPHTRRRRS
jgi:hypothetical protein